jgi:hypothetical protein
MKKGFIVKNKRASREQSDRSELKNNFHPLPLREGGKGDGW